MDTEKEEQDIHKIHKRQGDFHEYSQLALKLNLSNHLHMHEYNYKLSCHGIEIHGSIYTPTNEGNINFGEMNNHMKILISISQEIRNILPAEL